MNISARHAKQIRHGIMRARDPLGPERRLTDLGLRAYYHEAYTQFVRGQESERLRWNKDVQDSKARIRRMSARRMLQAKRAAAERNRPRHLAYI